MDHTITTTMGGCSGTLKHEQPEMTMMTAFEQSFEERRTYLNRMLDVCYITISIEATNCKVEIDTSLNSYGVDSSTLQIINNVLANMGYIVNIVKPYYISITWYNYVKTCLPKKFDAHWALSLTVRSKIENIDYDINKNGFHRWRLDLLDFKVHSHYINTVVEKYKTQLYSITYTKIGTDVKSIVIMCRKGKIPNKHSMNSILPLLSSCSEIIPE
jgi:hypothetical protein